MESGDKIMKRLTMHANVQSLTEYVGVTRCADNTWCCGGQGSGCCSISSRLFALAATVGPATASTSISDSMSVTKPTMSSGPVNGIVSAISTVKVSTSTTLDPTSTPRVPAKSLSVAATTGIAVGVATVVILLSIIAILVIKLKKKKDGNAGLPKDVVQEQQEGAMYGQGGIMPYELGAESRAVELGKRDTAELSGYRGPVEIGDAAQSRQ
jgi:hypothetical protein